jgi:hypothetical protein
MGIKKPFALQAKGFVYRYHDKNKIGGYLLSQDSVQVPSAMRGLTALFGMGRGEHPRQCHHKGYKQS